MPSPPTEPPRRRPLADLLAAFWSLGLLAALAIAAMLAAIAAWSVASAAEPTAARALLIGVGDYPGLPARLRLTASAGDAARMRGALIAAGLPAAAIRVMSDREGARPTRAAVLAALRGLAARARPGEEVLIYFSGHGAQAPARHPEREPDGLEELYLMADAARWDGSVRRVPGAIADFELEAAIDAIRARGADVWFIADACHAAGLTRGAAAVGRVKSVSEADLGIPAAAALRGGVRDPWPLRVPVRRGAFAGFYAAAPGELAVERMLPPGEPDATPSSVFTFALARALEEGRTRSLRDLAEAASDEAAALGGGQARPVFEGALDLAPPLAGAERRYRVTRTARGWRVEAGGLEGLDQGAAVALFQGGRAAGRTRVERAGPADAWLRPVSGVPAGPLEAAPLRAADAAADRGRRILDLAAARDGRGPAAGLRLEARRLSAGCGPNPPARLGFPPQAAPLDLEAPAALRHCDVVYLRIENAGAASVDVSPLYVDAAGRPTALALAPSDDVRMAPGDVRYVAVRVLVRGADGRRLPHGAERLALLVGGAGSGRLDLRSLADPSLRGAAPDPEALGARTIRLQVLADGEF